MRKASAGIADLIERTSGEKINAVVTVDQPYAADQHETLWYRHPRGGQPKYLEQPMFSGYTKWFQRFADRMLRRGSNVERDWFEGPGSALQGVVAKNAPVEFGDLRRSAGLEVKVGSSVKFVKPPEQPRLTEWEMAGKDIMRGTDHGYRHTKNNPL